MQKNLLWRIKIVVRLEAGVVNYKLRKQLPEDVRIYAEPIAHDGGTSIGAAYLAYHNPKIKNS